jgi:hypothetical protein
VLIVGEVHTGLLRGRDPVTGETARDLVDLVAGERVLISERPRSQVRSPARPVGVDCPLGEPGEARQVRGVGTVMQRATITDGHVVQGSSYATLVQADASARRPWSHYLARPGVIETIGRTKWNKLADAFAVAERDRAALDLGGIADRAAGQVQRKVKQPGDARLRAARTRLRWIVHVEPGRSDLSGIHFGLHDDELRLLRFTVGAAIPADRLAAVCADVALHDWLLTTVTDLVRRAAIGMIPREQALPRLEPAVDYLLHLWLPGAHAGQFAEELWQALERRAGFTRQWDLLANRVRDQFAAGAATAIYAASRT